MKKMYVGLLSVILAGVLQVEAQAAPLAIKPVKSVAWADFLGMNTQFTWVSPEARRAQMAKMKELGLKWHREGIHWELLEPEEMQFRFAEVDDTVKAAGENGLLSSLYLVGSARHQTTAPAGVSNPDQYPPKSAAVYADRLAMLAERYPTVKAWQVWNEPNIPSFWQPNEDPAAYSVLLRESVAALAARAPAAQRVIGGMAYYSQMPIAGGLMFQALAGTGDLTPERVVAYHPYTNSAEGATPADRDFIDTANWLNTNLRQAGVKDIWATEFGWSSYAGPSELQPIVGEAGQADLTIRRLALMSAMDFNRVFLFTLADLDERATVRDRSYGLIRQDGTNKPVFTALKRMLATAGPSLSPADVPAYAASPQSLISISWKKPDGKRVLMFWANETGSLKFANSGSVVVNDPLTGGKVTVSPVGGAVSLSVGKTLKIATY